MTEASRPITAPPKSAGRPRSEAGRLAILDAAFEVLAHDGFGGLTIERVAATAGVGRPTIYRWWKSKGDLAVECFRERVMPRLAVVRTGSASADLEAFLRQSIEVLSGVEGRILASIVAEGQRCQVTLDEFQAHYVQIRRDEAMRIIADGIAQGVFRSDLDPQAAFAFMIGPILFQVLSGFTLDARFADAAIGFVMDGIAARGAVA